VRLLLSAGADMFLPCYEVVSILCHVLICHMLCLRRYCVLFLALQLVRLLLSAGADVSLPWAKGPMAGGSPLYTAAAFGHVEPMKLLLGGCAVLS
jgi:hypothetical protein